MRKMKRMKVELCLDKIDKIEIEMIIFYIVCCENEF